jgi:cell division protein FtsQ
MNKTEITKTLKRLGWLIAFFVATAMIISAVERKEASEATGMLVEIEPLNGGHMLILEEDVLKTIDRSFGFKLEEMPLGAIDIERLERVLEEDPFILDADAYIDAKNRINIRVEQRQPVLRIIDNNGLNYYLDQEGLKMPLSRHFTARVLVGTGYIPPHVPDFLEREQNRLKDLFLLAQRIRQDAFFNALFEQIYINQTGEFILAPKVGDQQVILGPYYNVDEKLQNLKIFYREAIPYEGWQKYRTINLTYDGQVVCQKND